jgi:hypothetical protein
VLEIKESMVVDGVSGNVWFNLLISEHNEVHGLRHDGFNLDNEKLA